MKFCVDCKFCQPDMSCQALDDQMKFAKCTSPKNYCSTETTNIVSGKITHGGKVTKYCDVLRNYWGLCGEGGEWFVPKNGMENEGDELPKKSLWYKFLDWMGWYDRSF